MEWKVRHNSLPPLTQTLAHPLLAGVTEFGRGTVLGVRWPQGAVDKIRGSSVVPWPCFVSSQHPPFLKPLGRENRVARARMRSKMGADVEQFIPLVRQRLEEMELPIVQLSNESGISRQHIYRILNETSKPSLDAAVRISEVVGLRLKIFPRLP